MSTGKIFSKFAEFCKGGGKKNHKGGRFPGRFCPQTDEGGMDATL
jgi:hypothetical protein